MLPLTIVTRNSSPVIDEVYDKGIPVIVFDRKTNSEKFTAIIGADNHEMGRLMGEYIATRLNGKGRVLEIKGLKGSSPAIERHEGFLEALEAYPGITLVASLQGDWTEQSAIDAIKAFKGDLSHIDFVFGQNDRMAVGASKALPASTNTKYCGIDALPGEGNGIACVRDSILEASYIYPTRGDEVLKLAVDILEGKPYSKENPLMAALVMGTHLEQLHDRADEYQHQLSNQRIITMMAIILVTMLLILMIVIYRYFLQKARITDERNKMEREQLDFFTKVSHELRTPLTLIEGPLAQLRETKEIKDAGAEASGLFAIVSRNTHQLTELINKMLDAQVQNDLQKVALEQDDTHLTKGDETIDKLDTEPKALDSSHSDQLPTYQINEASDGQQGLALANEIVPDLIVSDVMMPVMNGLEFCQRVKINLATSHIPVILLTARALSQHQIEGYESGADAYITKPFSSDLLLARISNLLKSRQLLKGVFGTGNGEKNAKTEQQPLTEKEDIFLTKFREFIEKNLSDSDLGVETIGAELGLSRVQLYRKIKALTGLSPVELLRTARLQKGRQLLERTDKTISEIAYEVGFTAPSYFTKCFKDEFGISPSDL